MIENQRNLHHINVQIVCDDTYFVEKYAKMHIIPHKNPLIESFF